MSCLISWYEVYDLDGHFVASTASLSDARLLLLDGKGVIFECSKFICEDPAGKLSVFIAKKEI